MKKRKEELRCHKCKQISQVLYSNLKTDDFFCKVCYTKIYKEDIILIDPQHDLLEDSNEDNEDTK